MYFSHAKQQACTFGITINKKSVVCSSNLLSFSFFSLASLFKKNPQINKLRQKRGKNCGDGLTTKINKLVYSVNLSTVFSPKSQQTLQSLHPGLYLLNWWDDQDHLGNYKFIETVLFQASQFYPLILITPNHPTSSSHITWKV